MVIDPSVLAAIARELGEDAPAVLDGFLADFRSETPVQLEQIARATDPHDQAKAVHRLRGSALNLGAVELVRVTADAERTTTAGTVLSQEQLQAIIRALSSTIAEMDRRWGTGWQP